MKYIDKFIRFFFGRYVTDYSQFSKIELEAELVGVKKVRFIPKLKNGYWLEGTYLLLMGVIAVHIYKYFTETDNLLILKSFIYSLLGITFCRLMILLDRNIRIFRINKQLLTY